MASKVWDEVFAAFTTLYTFVVTEVLLIIFPF